MLLRLDTCADLVSLACAEAGDRVIDADPGWLRPHILLHELGHVFDQDMAPWAREAFAAIIHRHDPWGGPLESSPPSEQFAEAYALCARHPRIRHRRVMSYHYSPTPAQHRAVCALIRSAAP